MTKQFSYYHLLVVSFTLFEICSAKCGNFKSITVTVTSTTRDIYDITFSSTFSGCIAPESFQNNVEELAFLDQDIFIIANRSIFGISELRKLIFIGCPISEITPGALSNLPNLKIFHLRKGNLTIINSGVFTDVPALGYLSFEENDIYYIQEYAFANLSSLIEIDLSRNDLNDINNKWFVNSHNIKILDLSHNSLTKLSRKNFLETQKLQKIFLDNNDIEIINEGTFEDLKEIKVLALRRNSLREFDANIFGQAVSLENLSLGSNFLNYLSLELLKKLSVRMALLEGNPWSCLCLTRIYDWLVDRNGTLDVETYCMRTDIPRCVFSEKSNSHCIETIDEDLTEKYFKALNLAIPPVDNSCARFD